MDLRRLQGWALVASGVLVLLSLLGSGALVIKVLLLVGTLLLMFGIPAVQSLEPERTIGLIGILLIELGALVALAFELAGLGGSPISGQALPFAGALLGSLGRVVIGWLTSKGKAFAHWIGWVFIAEGVLNFAGGLLPAGGVGPALGVLIPLLGAIALIGYGWRIARS